MGRARPSLSGTGRQRPLGIGRRPDPFRQEPRPWAGVSSTSRDTCKASAETTTNIRRDAFVVLQPNQHTNGARAGNRTLNLGIKRLRARSVRERQRVSRRCQSECQHVPQRLTGQLSQSKSPCCCAQAPSSVRELMLSFPSACWTWLSTVRSERRSRAATSLFDRPRATSCATSNSRCVSWP